MTEKKLA